MVIICRYWLNEINLLYSNLKFNGEIYREYTIVNSMTFDINFELLADGRGFASVWEENSENFGFLVTPKIGSLKSRKN
jgi:hypothetical protein